VNIVRQDGGWAQDRSCETSCGGQIEVVWPVGDQFVSKSFEDVIAAEQKRAGHLLHIAGGKSDEVAFEPRKQHAVNAFTVEILAQFGVSQAERLVEFAGRIREARKVVQFIRSEKLCGALFCTQMHEGQPGPFGFQFVAKSGELGDRLATEGSAKVTKEDQQEWAIGRNDGDRLAGL